MRQSYFMNLGFAVVLALYAGCTKNENPNTSVSASATQGDHYEKTQTPAGTPVFTIAWSPYTSWSALASAETFGYLDNRQGYQGEYERQNSVDIVFQRLDYVPSFGVYGAGTVDGLTITNTDAFAVAMERKKSSGDATVAVFPTSWSKGADKMNSRPGRIFPAFRSREPSFPSRSICSGVRVRSTVWRLSMAPPTCSKIWIPSSVLRSLQASRIPHFAPSVDGRPKHSLSLTVATAMRTRATT